MFQVCDSIVVKYLGWLPDRWYLSLRYRLKMGHRINWKNPGTFSEKLQWLKIYNRRPEYTAMVDKAAVKDYVAKIIGKEYIIPTLGVWERPEDIAWEDLPERFVLKATNGGGGCGVIICKDKDSFNKEDAIAQLNLALRTDIYRKYREWPYKNVPKRILAEMYIDVPEESSSISELHDYKFFCFNGKAHFFKVDFGRFTEHHANYFSLDGKLLEFGEKGLEPVLDYPLELPSNLNDMISIAERVSQGHPFLRVDLYNVEGKILFGELTFFPGSGMIPWTNQEADIMIGKYLALR